MCVWTALLCLICLSQALADDESYQEELQQVQEKIDSIRVEIQETQVLHDTVQTELRETERQISRIHKSLKNILIKLQAKKRELNKLKQRRKNLRKNLQKHMSVLKRQIRTAYMIGRQDYMKLILNQQDPAAVSRIMTYYEYMNRARLDRIETVNKTINELKQIEKKIARESKKLEKLKHQQLAKKKELQEVINSRSKVMADLNGQLKNKERVLVSLVQDQRRLQSLVDDLDEAIPDILTDAGDRRTFKESRGEMLWPTKGTVRKLYGQTRESRLKWNGIIIKANAGKDVRAVSHGRIAYADWLKGYGWLVIIDHGEGYMSLYGYNQAILKETGEWVDVGDVIASVGNSGGQTEFGVYFEIRVNGKPSNPSKWCR